MLTPSFESQPHKSFKPSTTFDTVDGLLEVYEVKPAEPVSDVPVLVSPGFSQGSETLQGVMQSLGESRHAVMANLPHGRPSAIRERQLFNESPYQQGKAMTHIDTIERLGLEKVDAIGHSEGAVNLVMAAALYPEKFRNIVLINPGGLMGKDNVYTAAARFAQHRKDITARTSQDKALHTESSRGQSERRNNMRREITKSYEASKDLAETQLEEIMAIAKANGVNIAIVHTKDDMMYPLDRVRQMNQRYRSQLKLDEIEPGTTTVDSEAELIDAFYEYPGTHVDFYLHPKKFMRYCKQALQDLEVIT